MKVKRRLSVQEATEADHQLRFALDLCEGVIQVLRTQLSASALWASTPEVERAFRAVEQQLARVDGTLKKERTRTFSALSKRAISS